MQVIVAVRYTLQSKLTSAVINCTVDTYYDRRHALICHVYLSQLLYIPQKLKSLKVMTEAKWRLWGFMMNFLCFCHMVYIFAPFSNPYLKPDFLLLLTVSYNDLNYKEAGRCVCKCVSRERVMVLKCHTRSLTISWLLLCLYIHGSHPEGIINVTGTYQQDRKEIGG